VYEENHENIRKKMSKTANTLMILGMWMRKTSKIGLETPIKNLNTSESVG
jgi:hypothetical protein